MSAGGVSISPILTRPYKKMACKFASFLRGPSQELKYKITLNFQFIDIEFTENITPNKLNVICSKGKIIKSTESLGIFPTCNSISVGGNKYNVQANFPNNTSISFITTFHPIKKDSIFQPKLIKFQIEEINSLKDVRTILASAKIDISIYAGPSDTNSPEIKIEMKPSSKKTLSVNIQTKLAIELDLEAAKNENEDFLRSDSFSSLIDTNSPINKRKIDPFQVNFSISKIVFENKNDVITANANMTNEAILELEKCNFFILLFISVKHEQSFDIFKCLNLFRLQIKNNISEIIYLSMDSSEFKLHDILQHHAINFPAVKPNSRLFQVLKQKLFVEQTPQLVVISNKLQTILERITEENILNRFSISPDDLIQSWDVGSESNCAQSKSFKVQTKMKKNEPVKDYQQEIQNLKLDFESSQTIFEKESNLLKQKINEMKATLDVQKTSISNHHQREQELSQENERILAEKKIQTMLMKRGIKGPTAKKWKIRYFEVKGTKICYYKKNEEKGSFEISNITKIYILNDTESGENNRQALFNLDVVMEYGQKRTFEIMAQDCNQMKEWIGAVEHLRSLQQYIKLTK